MPLTTARQVRAHPTFQRVRDYWRAQHQRRTLACSRCGQPIDHARGRDRTPWSLDVGHIVGAHEALTLSWPIERINAITNTQPEHGTCNASAGATYGNRTRATPRPQPLEASEW